MRLRRAAAGLAETAVLIVLFLLLTRPALAQMTLTGSVSPQQVSYAGTLTYTANASGGDPSTTRYAFFRRRPGGTWIPDVNAPTWQSSNSYAWHPTLSDVGTWETYIWVKDGTTPSNQNTYGYAAGFNTMPIDVVGPPSAPGPTTVSCAYTIGDECWVTGDFVASVSASSGGLGSLSYHVCRSNDTTGWGGCDVTLTVSPSTSYTVSGSQLPPDGYRRAYYFRAGDSAGAWSGWNSPIFIKVDRYAPNVSASNASATWYSYRTATVSASDSGSGVASVRYSWGSPLDGNCTAGTATSSGATLIAPNGDNTLYLCARDNTGQVGQWSGQYRVSAMGLTGSVSPSQASYLGSFTWTMSASGGTPATTRYAFFRRPPGGTWYPSVYSPVWQSSNVFTWQPSQSDVGTWETYVWVKDGDTPPDANTYGYAAGFNTMPITVAGPPTTPGATTVSCAYWVAATGDCWVAGDFVASVTASTGGMGSLVYNACRSNDTSGWGGCDSTLTLSGGTSYTVSGTQLPADGYRRAYYFRAGDSAGAWSGWNVPAYVRVDRYAPTVSASNASDSWFPSRTATVSASDTAGGAGASSGLLEVRYSWNNALDAACTTGTVTSSGATLTAPAGDNLLYLCARDNVQRVTQWNGRYRVSAPLSLTGSISPSQGSYLNGFTYTATASGGDPATLRYAYFHRRPGGTWIPDVNNPTWLTTSTYTWMPTAADAGTWETYIWVKDGYTSPTQNTYGYAAGFNTMPVEVVGPPTVPGATTVTCAYSVAATGDCWVTGNFTASVTASTGGTGSLVYQICRSNDSAGGAAGCDVNLTLAGGTSLAVAGADLPGDGYRRAYFFQAKDTAGAWSGWNVPAYVRVDRYAPTVSASNASATWFSSRTAMISAADATGGAGANSGLQAVRYSWNTALDANCTTGTATSSGTTLTAPSGDNVLYLCARDNTGRIAQWSGQYRIAPITLTGSVSPSQASYLGSFTWTMAASGGTPATTRYAFFRRRPGGTWIPDVTNPTWQAGNTYTWHPTQPDAGTWETYVWVRDGDTPPDANTYGYAAGLNTLPIEVVGPPTVPGATTVACAYSVPATGDCWVTGDFTASVTASTGGLGSLVYQICRSNDSAGGAAGCNVNLTLAGGTSLAISGADLPGDGYRRAYLFQAKDTAGALSGWNTPAYVRVDRYAPTVSASNASDDWLTSLTATISAADATGGAGSNSGLQTIRYSWNTALDAACTAGTSTTSGTTLTAPLGDNVLYLCARDNVGRVTQWSGRYRLSSSITLTGSISPSQASYLGSFTYTASASGGDPATLRYAFFRRRPGGTWIPDVSSPAWQAANTFTWHPAQSDAGTWETYIWVKDGTTPVNQNTYGYAAGFNTMPVEVVGPPAVPGATTLVCDYTAPTGDCWVNGENDVTASVTPSTGGLGSLVYQICRSNDSPGGLAGCDVALALAGGTSIVIPTSDMPADGFRRAYFFQAKDSAGALSGWNTPAYLRADRNGPDVSATNSSDEWFSSRTATVTATDEWGGAAANSGLRELRYLWNADFGEACAGGTAVAPGTTLTAPAGDNMLYLCARDNVGWVVIWGGWYRVNGGSTALTLTGTISPAKASYPAPFTYTATASGGDAATWQFAFFRRRPGGTWIPDVHNPAWQAGNTYTWTAQQADVGTWETYIWVKDGNTPADANGGYGYAAGFNPGPIEVLAPLTLTGSRSPSQATAGDTLRWTAFADGGDAATRQFAFFRRRPGGTWIPSVSAPDWQTSNVLTWTPGQADVGTWETYIWVKDATTPASQNTYGYGAGYNPGPVEIVAPEAPDFALALTPSAHTITKGGSAQYTLSITGNSTFTGSATLSLTDLPAGVSYTLEPATIEVGDTATLTLSTTSNTPPGSYELEVAAMAGNLTRTAVADLTVNAPAATGAPVIDSISPESFDGGRAQIITLIGHNLQGASVTVADEDPDPDNPSHRVFPAIGLIVASEDGTRIDVEVDCTARGVMDFYELVVDNGVGKAASRPFRVVPVGPVVDLVTPSKPERGGGNVYVLTLGGYHLQNATVRSDPAGAIVLYGVEAVDDSHINGLLRVPDNAPLGNVDLVVTGSNGYETRVTIEIAAPGSAKIATQRLGTRSLDPLTLQPTLGASPPVLFQRFALRDLDNTEVTAKGMRVRTITSLQRKVSAKSFSFYIYYQYTLNLLNFSWTRAFVFDPLTAQIGDEILKGLGLGDKIHMGAFVLSFALRVDLTIQVYITNTGFTWPLFCFEISTAIQIPGTDGFYENWSYCRGGTWFSFRGGSTDSLSATGGPCAKVTPDGPPANGVLFADVEQTACCSQPIEVSGNGYSAITGPFAITTPNAGSTTPGPSCTCSVSTPPACVLKGQQQTYTAQGAPAGGTFQWRVVQGGNRVNIVNGANSGTLTLEGATTSDNANDVQMEVVYTNGANSCTQRVGLSVVDIVPLEFRASGQADADNDKSNTANNVLTGLPQLGSVTPGNPPSSVGFFKNMQVRAEIIPCDPNLQCKFDFKRIRQGVVAQIDPNGTVTIPPNSGTCPNGGCDDDTNGNTLDEDLQVDPSPGCSIYVLDTPGIRLRSNSTACQGGNGVRIVSCFNFNEWLEMGGRRVTPNLPWHASTRLRCNGTNFVFDNGGAGNGIGLGPSPVDCLPQTAYLVASPPMAAQAPTANTATERVALLEDSRLSVRSGAYDALLRKAQRGGLKGEERDKVVTALIRLAGEDGGDDFQPAPLLAIELLGELRAAEAVPVLLDRLLAEFTRAVVSDADHATPAAQALAKIGAPAIGPLLNLAASAGDEAWLQAQASLELMHQPARLRETVKKRLAELAVSPRDSTTERTRLRALLHTLDR